MFTQLLHLAAVVDQPAVCPVLPEVDVESEDALALQDGAHRPDEDVHINNGRLAVVVRPVTFSVNTKHFIIFTKTTFLILGSYLLLSKIWSSVRDTVRAITVLLVSFSFSVSDLLNLWWLMISSSSQQDTSSTSSTPLTININYNTINGFYG